MNEIRIYKSIWQGMKMILLSSLFVLPSIYFLTKDDGDKGAWWMTICFFGLGYPVGLFLIFDRRPKVIVNEIGIYDRDFGDKIINWEIIRDAYPGNVGKQKFICLVVDEDFVPSKSKGKLYKVVTEISLQMGMQEINIPVSQLQADANKLLELIQSCIVAERPERSNILQIKGGVEK